MPNRWKHLWVGVLAPLAAAAWLVVPVWAAEPIFGGTDVLDLTIEASLDGLKGKPSGECAVAGTIEFDGGAHVPMSLKAYGTSRLEECDSPSLEISFDPQTTAGTPFEGHRSLRMVRPCHRGSRFDSYILLEYLVYRSYAIVAEPALRARLVHCRFRGSDRSPSDDTRLAFLVEDIGQAAARHGLKWLDVKMLEVAELDPDQSALLALFQYMVGNTDWSALMSSESERCCHNMAVLGVGADGGRPVLLPFDFDYAGIVNTPYALPDEQLPIQRVTQRIYRGFCAHNDRLPTVIEHFNLLRPRVEDLFADDRLPNHKARARALQYIGSFYDTINDPRSLRRKILGHCR